MESSRARLRETYHVGSVTTVAQLLPRHLVGEHDDSQMNGVIADQPGARQTQNV